ncbi:MAG: T9SS type A sorting domain-containing protein [Flavobacteriales bacterium]|nr:T9SS type A sorting domain-containing protein [Flavobacteriales bacterium]
MKKVLLYIALITCLGLSNNTFGSIHISNTQTGSWNTVASWLTGTPICGSIIHIRAGDTISILALQDYGVCGAVTTIIIDGTLAFPVSGPKLKLPAGSSVSINSGGLITSPGNHNSNKISIAGNWVWESGDPDVLGPVTFNDPSVLPVELLNFEVRPNGDEVAIQWTTATEINNSHFTVEKSLDIKKWKEVIKVEGAGNSNQLIDYTETDVELLEGTSYYRLKQTNYDGTYSYSSTVSVKYIRREDDMKGSINLYPNPVTAGGVTRIELYAIIEQEVVVILTDLRGKEHFSKTMVNTEENLSITVTNKKALPPGIYIVTVSSTGQLYQQKLIVK